MSDTSCYCCQCCTKFILTAGLTALFLWLSLRTSNPTCSIQEFYLPALNKTSNSTSNHTLYFDLQLHNKNKEKSIYYSPLNLTFYYNNQNATTVFQPIGNFSLPGFHQGNGKKARRKYLVETYNSVPWDEIFRSVFNGSNVVFRVDLLTVVRFKILFWKTKRYKLDLKGNMEVNDSGKKVNEKGVKLRSGAANRVGCYRALVGMLVGFGLLVFLL